MQPTRLQSAIGTSAQKYNPYCAVDQFSTRNRNDRRVQYRDFDEFGVAVLQGKCIAANALSEGDRRGSFSAVNGRVLPTDEDMCFSLPRACSQPHSAFPENYQSVL